MASSIVSRYLTFLVLSAFFFFFFPALSLGTVDAKPPFSFSFERFEKNQSHGSLIALYGDAEISDSAVRMSSRGRIMCRKPIRFLGTTPGFSTYFSFSISPAKRGGLAFLMDSKEGHRSAHPTRILAVEFATGMMNSSSTDPSANYIQIDACGERSRSFKSSNISSVNFVLNNGEKLHSWIEYDGVLKKIEVRLSKSKALKPSTPLISYPVDLSNLLWREAMFVGISFSGANATKTTSLYSWRFVVKHGATYLMHSEPLDPRSFLVRPHEGEGPSPIHVRTKYIWRNLFVLVLGAAIGALAAFIVFFVWFSVGNQTPVAPVEFPVHHVEFGYEKIVLDGEKVVDNATKIDN